ncbi:MAG TPA: cytochrome c maturation protein CcmE [Sediminibacterium sp.]
MKKIQIALLLLFALGIATITSFIGSLTTYETVASAKEKPGKFLHLVARLDKTRPVEYDALKDPNYLSFTAIDSVGNSVKVVYRNTKPDNLESSERLVLKGSIRTDYFECREILLKCPSKYKEEAKSAGKSSTIDKSVTQL